MKIQTSNEQLSLFEPSPPAPPPPLASAFPGNPSSSYNLFLALFPDSYAAQQMAEIGMALRRERNLWAKMRPIKNLHVSLHSLNSIANLNKKVGPVCEAVAAVTSPFEIRFDRIMSFRAGGRDKRPLVLAGDDKGNADVKRLHGALRTEFAIQGPTTGLTTRLTPHVTLFYEQLELPFESVEPVCWTVKEIVFVGSEVGKTKYHVLGRWPLGG
jgi:2'-5' RNA ligase